MKLVYEILLDGFFDYYLSLRSSSNVRVLFEQGQRGDKRGHHLVFERRVNLNYLKNRSTLSWMNNSCINLEIYLFERMDQL